jgi:arsenate reductase (glutaredoxin)
MCNMIIYVYSKCSTCQKALSFLKRKEIPFEQKEITLTPPSIQELERMLHFNDGKLHKLFNTSGMLYREMQLSEKLKTMSQAQALTLLTQHGMLVKRPFLLGSNFGLLGFNENSWVKTL